MKLILALVLMSLPVAAAAQTPAAADTPGKTASGIEYVQPKDWTATTQGSATVFLAPEGDLRIAVVDIGAAPDAAAAAEKGWAAFRSGATPKPRLVTAAAPGDGWDERTTLSYETSPAERAVRAALAFRKGSLWTVMLMDGAAATAAKRSAAASVVQQNLRPAGYQRETFAGKTAHALTPERIQTMRDFVAESAAALGVPGVGIALIEKGKVVWQGGVGVRALGSSEPVDENTKFMIASNTKGMATLLLSVLADEGKLQWDQRVVDLYPAFRLGDDATTQSVQVRHLVCACTGLPRKDYSFILADAGAPASATFDGLAHTQPTSKFGELFQYNNLMASAAGYLGGALSYPGMELGAAFDHAMEEKIFAPLGMRDTTFDFEKGMSGNWAPPHGVDINGQIALMSNDFNLTVYPHRPAGGAFSTAADMAHYVQLELSKGLTPGGKRLVSEANLVERRKRGVQVGDDSWYGMGLFERTAWGVPVVTHGGTLLGYHSNWYALPEADVGAVILTNGDTGAAMLGPFLRRLLEVLYDGKPEAARDVAAAATRVKAQAQARRERLTFPGDPAVLAGLAAHYRDPSVGNIAIMDRDGRKWIKAGFIEGPLATRVNPDGTTSLVSAGPGAIQVDALVGKAGDVRTLTINDGQQHQYVYSEVR
ncbi:serine hydrolase domain-containing protein [Sphingosinicella soli]|uniref:CubicO group peptidase (Beta-lactamase class C family) n=1 Tax=Sphingosinicella soli TaxID=333708 RepID=A0A7W7B0N6_9SPHN|nr:serine hydrolase domain-containing protein [Sphingosinicella soli]MBB4630888.1 CubicO group peptidase (beta-lactamase class C family) [Sphingosinicella soli]